MSAPEPQRRRATYVWQLPAVQRAFGMLGGRLTHGSNPDALRKAIEVQKLKNELAMAKLKKSPQEQRVAI